MCVSSRSCVHGRQWSIPNSICQVSTTLAFKTITISLDLDFIDKQGLGDLLVLPLSLRVIGIHHPHTTFWECWGLDSGVHACAASALSTYPVRSPPILFHKSYPLLTLDLLDCLLIVPGCPKICSLFNIWILYLDCVLINFDCYHDFDL